MYTEVIADFNLCEVCTDTQRIFTQEIYIYVTTTCFFPFWNPNFVFAIELGSAYADLKVPGMPLPTYKLERATSVVLCVCVASPPTQPSPYTLTDIKILLLHTLLHSLQLSPHLPENLIASLSFLDAYTFVHYARHLNVISQKDFFFLFWWVITTNI